MNILMMTNTYTPHLGGVARSVSWFTEAFRQRGHRVLVVAPTFEDMPEWEEDVVRVPAIQHFNGSDFSVRLPMSLGPLASTLDEFEADLVHSHHPFLLGDTALRVAALRDLPIVFTHHTLYERYTHYVPGDSPAMKRFVKTLATEYCNLCDHVIAPSESVAELLAQRGVTSPVAVIPTGVDEQRFAGGDGSALRRRYGIPAGAFVVGHVGRLAPEKNLEFLARATAEFVAHHSRAHFLVVGDGPSRPAIEAVFAGRGLEHHLHLTGSLDGQQLADAYHAMDVFAFASQSETQGMVLAEAMTAAVPVVAVDAPGVREVVRDGSNGRLLGSEQLETFCQALAWSATLPPPQQQALREAARETARQFSMSRCASRTLELYESLIEADRAAPKDDSLWAAALRRIKEEWYLWAGVGHAVEDALLGTESPDEAPQ